jgi:predicted nucleic acid-binding protein
MRVLLDTNILLRLSEPTHIHHPAAIAAVRFLAGGGDTFCISSQTISEFLAVATRSVADRGLGMAQAAADAELSKLIAALDMLFDSSAVIAELRGLVIAHAVAGKSVHDCKIVATMLANGVKEILTFNGKGFTRFKAIVILDPSIIAKTGGRI